MVNVFLVGAGGVCRRDCTVSLGGWIQRLVDNPWRPWGTFAANALGSLVIGFLSGLAEPGGPSGPKPSRLSSVSRFGSTAVASPRKPERRSSPMIRSGRFRP